MHRFYLRLRWLLLAGMVSVQACSESAGSDGHDEPDALDCVHGPEQCANEGRPCASECFGCCPGLTCSASLEGGATRTCIRWQRPCYSDSECSPGECCATNAYCATGSACPGDAGAGDG